MDAPEYAIDPVTLREVVADGDAAAAWVTHLRALGPDGDAERVAWLRMLGRLREAEVLGWQVLARAGGPGSGAEVSEVTLPTRAVGAALRLAHVLHWQGRFRDADELFSAARARIDHDLLSEDESVVRHAMALHAFTDQHQGKARFDEGRLDEAVAMLESALLRRQVAGAPADQLASSRLAVEAVRRRRVRT